MLHVWKKSNNLANEIHYVQIERERESESKQLGKSSNDQRRRKTSKLGQNQRKPKARVDLNDQTLDLSQTPQEGSRNQNDLNAQLR